MISSAKQGRFRYTHSRDPALHGERVVATDVAKVYASRRGEVEAIKNISVTIEPGEFVSIVGPSGCGKSTFLSIVAGLTRPTSGVVSIGDTVVRKPFTDLGVVFQDPVLLDWRRVLGNVMLQAELRGLDKRLYTARAEELLRRVGLLEFKDRYPFELSGGMRQRVSICRAILHEPRLLLMDEPFGAVDALTRDQMNMDLQQLWLDLRNTVVFVTHSISEAVFLSDRVLVMSPRPCRVVEEIKIDLPRPRIMNVREDSVFGRYVAQIRHVFESLGVLHDSYPTPGDGASSVG